MIDRFRTGAAAALLIVPAAAHAAPTATVAPTSYTFNTVGTSSAVDGTYGKAATFGTTATSPIKLSVTAWQANLNTNAVRSAYLGTYTAGLGVTGADDYNGAYNLHQIDNISGYTDFLLLEFNQAVTLASITTQSFGIAGIYQNDAVWYDASGVKTSAWNSTAGFAGNVFQPADWHDVADGASGAVRTTGATTASTKWLIGAAIDPLCDRWDGFKLSSVTVTPVAAAVPEPATWGMMILGLGVAGTALRRARRRDNRGTTAAARG